MADAALRLVALVQAEGTGQHFVATDSEPWLGLRGLDVARLAGLFVEITYRASLLDDPARPIFRFEIADGTVTDRIGAAPIAGAAVWIGRLPPGTTRIAVSPTNRLGRFSFLIERVRRRHWLALLFDSWRRRPRQTRSAVLTRLIGWRPESDNNLAWALGAFDLGLYASWSAARVRPFDSLGLDAFRDSSQPSTRIIVVVRANSDVPALERTFTSLRAQAFAGWQAWIVGTPCPVGQADPRIAATEIDALCDRFACASAGTLVCALTAGDILPEYALAFLVEQRHRHPSSDVFYGDEFAAGQPVLKPGWCPRLMAARLYLGRAVFVSGLSGWTFEERRRFILESAVPTWVSASPASTVRPLRRVLLATRQPSAPAMRTSDPGVRQRAEAAAIIILTRDRPDLLERAVASIRAKSRPGSYRLVIVDNGSAEGPAQELLGRLVRERDVVLLHRRGPFNFSAFCNEAASVCDEQLLVFINDDTEILSDDWLERLAVHAFNQSVGAVGGKLTFPDGRLQHVGVVVGMGGNAGHFGAPAPGDDPGWLGRNGVVHEVSAVTGACLAVAREKFLAVGGFDAAHLPIELSDIDLCLKLNARGWQTLVDPNVHLMHEESASRGGARLRRLDVYARQRDVFVERWRHVLRDDPAFHPGLSLYSLQAALG